MKSIASGVFHSAATRSDLPTIATTSSSRPAEAMVARNVGSESILPKRRSISVGSWWAQPGWISSEPRWWSTVKTTDPACRAPAPR